MSTKRMLDARDARAVLADRSLELGHLGQPGELVSLYTATRAWRGELVGRTGEVVILGSPDIVWIADATNINGKQSRYFVRGKQPVSQQEELSGARVVVVPLAGLVYACAHGIKAPPTRALDLVKFDSYGWPLPGVVCHYSTVTHEFRGTLAALEPGEWLELADDEHQAMVNEIGDGHFADVLHGAAKGTDHVGTAGIRLALHALTAIAVR